MADAPAFFTKLSDEQALQLRALPMERAIMFWDEFEKAAHKRGNTALIVARRALCLADLFFLLVRVCKREDMLHPWVFARCREVEAEPNGRLDLWAREHYKTTIITFGMTVQSILRDADVTIGIFSHTRPIAKAFLRQIMRELEGNELLHSYFPDVLWGKDVRAAPKWSEDDGIIVRRKSNPNEATIEAWGLVDGQPTSKHFKILLYDDVVTQASVTTPEMIEKTMTAVEQSYNLGTVEGVRRFAGTRWNYNDAYRTIADRGTAKPRVHPGRAGGEEDGVPVFWPEAIHQQKRRDMGPFTYAAQILLNPRADNLMGFKRDWLRHYRSISPAQIAKMNIYIVVDSANAKKKGSDYTAMWAIGLAADENFYALDMIRDRLNLTERSERLFAWHRKYRPRFPVRWERYGMMADIQHVKSEQERQNYRFEIVEVAGQTKKADRVGRLMPIFEQGRFYLPQSLHVTNYEKRVRDLVRDFIEEEYLAFPVGGHDDMLDALSRIAEPDLRLVWPKEEKIVKDEPVFRASNMTTAWMA